MKIQLNHKFEDIISVDNLLLAWQEFVKGKRNKKDVQEFSFKLMDNIILLHNDLVNSNYKHGRYQAFKIWDPKPIQDFLEDKLKLKLRPNKISIRTLNSGEDFLGWVNFPDHRILRTTTKRRMFKRIKTNPTPETLNSYLGLLKHGNCGKIKNEIFMAV